MKMTKQNRINVESLERVGKTKDDFENDVSSLIGILLNINKNKGYVVSVANCAMANLHAMSCVAMGMDYATYKKSNKIIVNAFKHQSMHAFVEGTKDFMLESGGMDSAAKHKGSTKIQ